MLVLAVGSGLTEFDQHLLVLSSSIIDWALSAWVIGGSKVHPRY